MILRNWSAAWMIETIQPDWPAPLNVRSFFTTRHGGFSEAPYASLNLARHVNDNPRVVSQNRKIIPAPSAVFWLDQQHTISCLDADDASASNVGDAAFTQKRNRVLAVLVADCLPVLVTNNSGSVATVIHAGWRGLANGIIERTLAQLSGESWIAWIGPHIRSCHYEVGEDVKSKFSEGYAFEAMGTPNKWSMNMGLIAADRLKRSGVREVFENKSCTYCEEQDYFSYRRDGETGRMAAVIWLD